MMLPICVTINQESESLQNTNVSVCVYVLYRFKIYYRLIWCTCCKCPHSYRRRENTVNKAVYFSTSDTHTVLALLIFP